jgi:hypothetical protein
MHLLGSISMNIQRKALKENVKRLPVYKLPLWQAGLAMMFVGCIMNFVALALAPQSLIAPLAALTLVWNMVMCLVCWKFPLLPLTTPSQLVAPCINKEKLGMRAKVATMIIFFGATLSVIFSDHTSPEYKYKDLLELYEQPGTGLSAFQSSYLTL